MNLLKDFIKDNTYLGQYFENDQVFAFFGNRHCNAQVMKSIFPNYEWSYINQVHGKNIIFRDSEDIEDPADGQYTNKSNIALCIRTADCMPVFWWGEYHVCALHCGWRGVEKNIIKNSFKISGIRPEMAAIGPFISKETFEVGKDVGLDIYEGFKKIGGTDKILYPHFEENKYYLDLAPVVRFQLGLPYDQLWESIHRTIENSSYYSFRRDPLDKGRNINFIVKK